MLLINEFDFWAQDPQARSACSAATISSSRRRTVLRRGRPIDYPYSFIAPSNTGIPSGKDLNNNGVIDTTPGDIAYGDDSFGFGEFPGKFGMVVYSRYPIDTANVRTFQQFLWKDMPGNLMPIPFYSPDEVAIFRLSSKSHWDIPIQIGKKTVHFLVSHPTPPVFDGPRTETAAGTTTRSDSGPTTSRRASRTTSTTTRACAAASSRASCS